MIKKTLNSLGKIVVSGIISFLVLNLFGYFYYNIPVYFINKDGSTDIKGSANAFYSQGLEGFAWGKANNDGFANTFDYYDDMEIDILIMGSSHMQGRQVDMIQSVASRLNTLLEKETVYNIGMSGHEFLTCASNFRAALTKYQPQKYVVVETSSVSFSNEAIALAISEETPENPSTGDGIIGFIRTVPYLRLIGRQMIQMMDFNRNLQIQDIDETDSHENFTDLDATANKNLLSDLLRKMSALSRKYDSKLVIVYHPNIDIIYDGSINLDVDQNTIAQFKELCENNGILFLDMSNRFKAEYENTYTLPYGFFNSPVGVGHMNKYGHAMMADELYNLILEDAQ